MNKENAHEYLPLVQALANGKQLQHKNEHGEWVGIETIVCVAPQKLRIKPEPRTFTLYVIDLTNGETVMTTHPTFDSRWKQITVQEVAE